MVQLQNPYAGAAQYATAQRYAAQRAGMAIGKPIERGIAGAYADWQREDERATRESQFKRSLKQRDKEWATGFNAQEDHRAWVRESMSERDRFAEDRAGVADERADESVRLAAQRYAEESGQWDRREERLGANARAKNKNTRRGQNISAELSMGRAETARTWREEDRTYQRGRDAKKDDIAAVERALKMARETEKTGSKAYADRMGRRDKRTKSRIDEDERTIEGFRKYLKRNKDRADIIRSRNSSGDIRQMKKVTEDDLQFLEEYDSVGDALDSSALSGVRTRPDVFGPPQGPTYDHPDDRRYADEERRLDQQGGSPGDVFRGTGY